MIRKPFLFTFYFFLTSLFWLFFLVNWSHSYQIKNFTNYSLKYLQREKRLTVTSPDVSNNEKLRILWDYFKRRLRTYRVTDQNPEFPTYRFNEVEINDQKYALDALWTKLDEDAKQGQDFTGNSRSQIQALIDDSIGPGEISDKLQEMNVQKLNTFWSNLKPVLEKYITDKGFQFDFIYVATKQYFINALWPKLSNSETGSQFSGEAKTQLQKLLNNDVNWNSIKAALDTANNAKLDDLWTALKTALADYAGYIPTAPISIVGNPYTINHLLDEKNDNLTDFSKAAKVQLQALVNNLITDASAVRAALDAANKSKLNSLWNAIQPLLNNYSNLEPNLISFNSRIYDINQLFAQKEHDWNRGSTISDSGNFSARSQLQSLVNAGMTIDTEMQTALTNANTALLTTLWGQIQDELQAYPGNAFSEQIIILNADTNKPRGGGAFHYQPSSYRKRR